MDEKTCCLRYALKSSRKKVEGDQTVMCPQYQAEGKWIPEANRTFMKSTGALPAETSLPVSHCRTWGPAPPATLRPQRSRTACTPAGRGPQVVVTEGQGFRLSLPGWLHNQELCGKGPNPQPSEAEIGKEKPWTSEC